MGLISGVGSMNAREQMDKFRDTVIAPILEYEAHLYTMILVRNGFKDMETEITSSVLGNNLNYTRAKLADMLYNKGEGVMTKDEVRTDILGLEALDEIVE